MTFATFSAGFPKQKQYQKPGKAVVEMSGSEGASALRAKLLEPFASKLKQTPLPPECSEKSRRSLTESLWFSACRGKQALQTTERHGNTCIKVHVSPCLHLCNGLAAVLIQ